MAASGTTTMQRSSFMTGGEEYLEGTEGLWISMQVMG